MELKNYAGTTGLIHESFRGWWRIPWALSLGIWHGKRHSIFYKGDGDFKLKVHFTVKLLGTTSRCTFNKRYAYKSGNWAKKTNSKLVLQEARTSKYECIWFDKWIKIATHFQNQAQNGDPVEDLIKDVNWTKLARDLEWKEPVVKIEADAVVTLIEPEIKDNDNLDDVETCPHCGSEPSI
ncbi:hypothetical protein CGRA01v4_08408 [Colletotrichum graminicola]|nr:hypothetical protein CGRA01v4_08408 [Colletotrichum graminicola]